MNKNNHLKRGKCGLRFSIRIILFISRALNIVVIMENRRRFSKKASLQNARHAEKMQGSRYKIKC